MAPPLLFVGAFALSTAFVLLLWALAGSGDGGRELVTSNLQRGQVTDLRQIRLARPRGERTIEPLMARLAALMRRITPSGSLRRLERKLVLAGRPTAWPIERVLAVKIILGGIGVLLAAARIATSGSGFVTVMLVVIAMLLFVTPDVVLSARASERQRAILHELPDTLDQMTICMEAGLGFEAALARTSQGGDGPLAQEIIHTLQEIQVGVGRRDQCFLRLSDPGEWHLANGDTVTRERFPNAELDHPTSFCRLDQVQHPVRQADP